MEDYDEPYYCSPAYGPDDYIFEGSDAEETPKETLAKRARYEEQAARISNGRLPTIMSASLRGPFERKSGWENPWRYRPRTRVPKATKEQDWWKPGAEDMMFTRENVLKRAADHGLGWMTPAAALEWCKASAETETEVEGGGQPNSTEPHVHSGDGNLRCGTLSTKDQLSTDMTDHPRQVEFHGEPTQSTINTGLTRNSFTRATERPHDSKWLKGSFTSKRARWNGSPTPSPTPLPGMHRGTRSKSRSPPGDVLTSQPASKRSPRLAHTPHYPESGSPKRAHQCPVGVSMRRSEFGKQSRAASSLGLTAISAKDRGSVGDGTEIQEEAISAISFRYSSTIRSGAPGTASNAIDLVSSDSETDSEANQVGFPARQVERRSPSQALEAETRNNVRRTPGNDNTMVGNNKSLEETSFVTEVAPSCRDLEKFQFRKKRKIYQQNTENSGVDFSLVKMKAKSPLVEPATTMRNNLGIPFPVEDIEDSEDWETTIDITDHLNAESSLDVLKSSKRKIRSSLHPASTNHTDLPDDDGDDEWETTIGEQVHLRSIKATLKSKNSLSPGVISVAEASPTRVQIAEESTTPPKSVCSSSSWDMMEVDASSSFRQVIVTSPAKSQTLQARQSIGQENPTSPAPDLFDKCGITKENKSTTPKLTSPTVAPPSQSSHRLRLTSPKKSPGLPLCELASQLQPTVEHLPAGADVPTVDENIDQNDISTQSANTTPTRSLKLANLLSPGVSIKKDCQHRISSDAVAIEEQSWDMIMSHEQQSYDDPDQSKEDDQDKMSQIQHTLSQICPGSSQDDGSSRGDVGEETELEEEFTVQDSAKQLIQSQSLDNSKPNNTFETVPEEIIISEEKTKARTGALNDRDAPVPTPMDDVVIENRGHVVVTPTPQHVPSWSASEPQSPWADDETLPPVVSGRVQEVTQADAATLYKKDEEPISTDWQQFERSLLAKHDKTTPFKTFATPIKSLKMGMVDTNKSIRSVEDATITNPWTSSMKKVGSNKTKKRVSFGFALATEEDESTAYQSPVVELPSKRSTSSQIDPLDDGNPPPRPIPIFNNPESRGAAQRTFKRMLPDKSASQLNSSPGPVEAMAEAFITADQEAPMKRAQPSPEKSTLQSPRMSCSSPWRDDSNKVAVSRSFMAGHDSFPIDDFMTDFDMAGAIGDATAFLEDWSVEAELEKARFLEATEIESNGMKRRKLFGIS